ncbi:MAG: cupin domain-containing protein [Deltaproteobacteria bacterium]|nr:cupin domain-containing protein [Deltaproteobacteria bacterium]
MERLDVIAAAHRLAELRVSHVTTEAEAMAAMRPLGMLNQCLLGVTCFCGRTPWERHPDGDELLYVLEGRVEVTVLAEEGPHVEAVPAGSLFVVPRGLWHRQHAEQTVRLLFATAADTTGHSWADDPREE